MRRSIVLAVFLAILLPPALSHAASLSGTFVDAARAPLAMVEVVLRRAADSTVVAHTQTGVDGRFRLDGLAFDRYLLRASLLGYASWLRNDVVLTATTSDVDLGTQALLVSPIALPEVETSTARPTVIVAPDRNIYLAKDIPGAGSGTATDVLRAVPELDVDLEGRVSLRGSPSLTIQLNGRAAPMKGEALTTFLRQMPASRIERVEVIANPSAKFDPEGMAGIVNIVLKDDVGLGLSGNVNLFLGQRWNGGGGRIAWQTGKLTTFGGLNGSWFRYASENRTVRRSLLTDPPSTFTWDAENEYRGWNRMFDLSVDYALTKRATFYATLNGWGNDADPHNATRYVLTDSTQSVTSRYDRTDDGTASYTTTSYTLGLHHVIQPGKNERTIELLHSLTNNGSETAGNWHTIAPTQAEIASLQNNVSRFRESGLQVDDTHPLGALGKLEVGLRWTQRTTRARNHLIYFSTDVPPDDWNNYTHEETFYAGYATVGRTFGRLSLQAGIRGEAARTTFDVPSAAGHYEHEFQSIFPSGNVSWDFGQGKVVRASYSKRIERPAASYLNPDALTSDSLNRFVGNPELGPRYTHSTSLDASWSGGRGTLRLSPYWRETVDNWDVVMRVAADGTATSTYVNASSVRVLGVTLTASLRQVGRVGGTASLGVSHDHHDATNVSRQYLTNVTSWSANGNLTYKVTEAVDLQSYLRYAPARALAQGRSSSYIGSSIGVRWKLDPKAKTTATLNVNDPFRLAEYSSSTGDATYEQRSESHNHIRGVSGSLTWTWGGKPPEQKQRRQTSEAPAQEGQGQNP